MTKAGKNTKADINTSLVQNHNPPKVMIPNNQISFTLAG
jgi:hypothetical protein